MLLILCVCVDFYTHTDNGIMLISFPNVLNGEVSLSCEFIAKWHFVCNRVLLMFLWHMLFF